LPVSEVSFTHKSCYADRQGLFHELSPWFPSLFHIIFIVSQKEIFGTKRRKRSPNSIFSMPADPPITARSRLIL
jgi:hypothetical protein